MDYQKRVDIVKSFPDEFESEILELDLSIDEYRVFENGIYSKDMDSKWNIFALNDHLYFSRSWTNRCIYKFKILKTNPEIIQIVEGKVASSAISPMFPLNEHIKTAKILIQNTLDRDDFFVDDRLEFLLIKKTIQEFDPQNIYKRSIGSQSVKLHKVMIQHKSNKVEKIGLENFAKGIVKYSPEYCILSLHLYKKNNKKDSITFYFNHDGTKKLGQVTIKRKKSSS